MKNILILFTVLIVADSAFSQQTNPATTLTKQGYLQKSRSQKTTAWVLLAGGTTLFTIGSIIRIDSDNLHGKIMNSLAAVLQITGGAAMVGSTPLFVAASKNKKKGMSLSISNQQTQRVIKNSLVYQPLPSLTLKITL